jgi:membrane protein implicated in regulation of membrane protease activity
MELITGIWLLVALVCLVGELAIPGISFFFALFCGASAAALMSWLAYELLVQIVVFTIVAGATGVMLQVVAKRSSHKRGIPTNVDALVGKEGMVLEPIFAHQKGIVKIGGELWTARSADGEAIEKDEIVEVRAISGSHLVVKRI